MKWAAVKSCPVYGGDVKSYDFDAIRNDAGRALRRPVPDSRSGADPRPHLQRRRRRHRRHAGTRPRPRSRRCRSSGTIPPEHAAFNTANMRAALLAALDEPGKVARQLRATSTRRSRAPRRSSKRRTRRRISPRARMEPGNATVLVTDDRVDIWIGDQSPQETRFSAAQITGIPEAERLSAHVPPRRRLRPQRQRSAGRAGDHDREREPRHADPPAVDARGRLHRHDVSRDGRRAAEGRVSTPTAGRSRSKCAPAMQEDGFGPDASFDVASRYYVPNYRFSNHTTNFHVPVGTRRGVGQAAHEFYRESFMDELAHAAGKDPYLYRRELHRAHQPSLQGRHDQGARHGRRDVGLGHAAARGHGARDRARGARRGRRRHGDDQRHGAHRLGQPRRQGPAGARRRRARRPASVWSTRYR